MELTGLIKRLNDFNPIAEFIDIMYQEGDVAVKLQIEQHILKSVRSTGEPIGKYTNSKYLALKVKQGSRTAPSIDFHRTGKVHEQTTFKKIERGIDLFTRETTTDKWMQHHFGSDIWGLTVESGEIFKVHCMTIFITKFNKKLHE